MKVGNKNQAVVLSVVAVAAVSFLTLQLKGAAGHAVKGLQQLASASGQEKEGAVASNQLPKTLYGDPFSHPALPRSEGVKTTGTAPPEADDRPVDRPGPMGGAFDFSPLGAELPNIAATAQVSAAPAPPEPKGPLISLQATVAARVPVAFLSIDGSEPKRYSVGEALAKGVQITGIRNGSVDIRISKVRKTLSVGESIQL